MLVVPIILQPRMKSALIATIRVAVEVFESYGYLVLVDSGSPRRGEKARYYWGVCLEMGGMAPLFLTKDIAA